MTTEKQRITLYLPPELIAKIDDLAAGSCRSRNRQAEHMIAQYLGIGPMRSDVAKALELERGVSLKRMKKRLIKGGE